MSIVKGYGPDFQQNTADDETIEITNGSFDAALTAVSSGEFIPQSLMEPNEASGYRLIFDEEFF